ncbi:MAG TPA: pitrilysin family protein [Mariprofundaceae bacterium]|nr:pitrilysin family protein [Mariprofundaceae bacterium]
MNLFQRLTPLLITALLWAMPAHAVPPIQEQQLNNGLRILLMEAHNVPMVSMQLSMAGGSRFDPKNKGGTAMLLAEMLGDHTARHDHEALAQLLDAEAIQLGAGADREGLNLSLTVLKEVLPSGINALAETLLKPGWDKARFKLIKENAISAAQKAQEEPGTRAAQASVELLFGDHPYGHPAGGTLATLKKIELGDLQRLYRAQLKPEGAVLAVSGDITMRELTHLLEPALKPWHGTPEKRLFDIEKAKAPKGETRTIEMPTTQTLAQLVRLGPARKDADFFPAFVLNHLLGGGGFGSRLMEEVREKRGLVYGVYSYFIPLATQGPFIITLQTQANQAKEAEAVVRDVINDMYEGNISQKQLQQTKANLIGSFAQRMDSNRERVGLMGMIGFYQMPLDYLQVWTEKVESVTLADVQDAAKAYMTPETWNLIQVGPRLIMEAPEERGR